MFVSKLKFLKALNFFNRVMFAVVVINRKLF